MIIISQFQEVAEDLYTSWREILYMCAIAFGIYLNSKIQLILIFNISIDFLLKLLNLVFQFFQS